MLLFITGGSGSGKSEYAEQRARSLWERSPNGRLLYLATMRPLDEESRKRVERHRRQRDGKQFETVECYTHLEELPLQGGETVLLECLSNLTANEMFSEEGRPKHPARAIEEGLKHLIKWCAHVVVVGNNVFEDGLEYDSSTVRYQKEMATLHRWTAAQAEEVAELVCGLLVYWKRAGEDLS